MHHVKYTQEIQLEKFAPSWPPSIGFDAYFSLGVAAFAFDSAHCQAPAEPL